MTESLISPRELLGKAWDPQWDLFYDELLPEDKVTFDKQVLDWFNNRQVASGNDSGINVLLPGGIGNQKPITDPRFEYARQEGTNYVRKFKPEYGGGIESTPYSDAGWTDYIPAAFAVGAGLMGGGIGATALGGTLGGAIGGGTAGLMTSAPAIQAGDWRKVATNTATGALTGGWGGPKLADYASGFAPGSIVGGAEEFVPGAYTGASGKPLVYGSPEMVQAGAQLGLNPADTMSLTNTSLGGVSANALAGGMLGNLSPLQKIMGANALAKSVGTMAGVAGGGATTQPQSAYQGNSGATGLMGGSGLLPAQAQIIPQYATPQTQMQRQIAQRQKLQIPQLGFANYSQIPIGYLT